MVLITRKIILFLMLMIFSLHAEVFEGYTLFTPITLSQYSSECSTIGFRIIVPALLIRMSILGTSFLTLLINSYKESLFENILQKNKIKSSQITYGCHLDRIFFFKNPHFSYSAHFLSLFYAHLMLICQI